jgi:heterodisulfide reductase subunit A
MKRIGVFVCHCGTNIADTVDVKRVVEEIQKHPDVVYAVDYKYMCSDPGQQIIRDGGRQHPRAVELGAPEAPGRGDR